MSTQHTLKHLCLVICYARITCRETLEKYMWAKCLKSALLNEQAFNITRITPWNYWERERFGSHSWAPDVFLLYFWTLFVYVHVPCNVTVIIYNVVNCNMFTNGGNSELLEHSVQLRMALLTVGTVLPFQDR